MNLFESVLTAQGYPISRAKARLAEIQGLSEAEFGAWQEAARWRIAEFHFRNNPWYRQLVGDSLPGGWEDLPIIEKAHLQIPLERLLAAGYTRKNVYVASTSGSSGHPFFFAKDKMCHALSWALVADRYGQHGLATNSRQARFYGIPLNLRGLLFEKAKDWIANRVRFPVFDLSLPTLDRFLRRLSADRFAFVYGYTSSIAYFARYLRDRHLTLREICPSLKVCIVTSEVCTAEDRKLIEDAFGVRVVNEYGASELGVLAFEMPDGRFLCSEEITFFENVTEADGRTALLCTSLFNEAYPLIRYRIGDSVDFEGDSGRKVIARINGRVNDFAILPSGRVSPGLTFYYVSRRVLESSGCLKEFIVRQTDRDTFVFDVVADRPFLESEIADIRREMDRYLEPGLKLHVNYVDHIPRKGHGKVKHFFSEIAQRECIKG